MKFICKFTLKGGFPYEIFEEICKLLTFDDFVSLKIACGLPNALLYEGSKRAKYSSSRTKVLMQSTEVIKRNKTLTEDFITIYSLPPSDMAERTLLNLMKKTKVLTLFDAFPYKGYNLSIAYQKFLSLDYRKALEYLFDSKSISASDINEWECLHQALDLRKPIFYIKLLVSNGADVNHVNQIGWPILNLAIQKQHSLETIIYLVEKGAKVNTLNAIITDHSLNFISPEHLASLSPLHFCRSINIAMYLLDKGANINARDSCGLTPLSFGQKFQVKEKAIDRYWVVPFSPEMEKFMIRNGALP